VPLDKFDDCGKKSAADLKAAIAANTLLPSVAHEMAVPRAIRGEFLDVVTNHFNSDMSSQDAVTQLAAAIERAKQQ